MPRSTFGPPRLGRGSLGNVPRWPFLGTLRGVFVTEGDSLTMGVNSADSSNDINNTGTVTSPRHTFANANASALVYDVSLGGAEVGRDMIGEGTSQVDAHYDATKQFNVTSLWGGTNDMNNAGRTPTQLLGDVQTWCLARKAVGWKVIVSNVIQRSGLSPTTVSDYNAQLLAAWTGFADAHIDAFTIVGAPGQSDGIHITTAQGALMASAWESAIRGII